MTGATAPAEWFYPRSFVTPSGSIFEIAASGVLWGFTTAGLGTAQRYQPYAPPGDPLMPTVMFAPGKLLSVRLHANVVIDINGPTPVVTATSNLDQLRYDASGTVLADGKVLVTGGSVIHNVLTGIAYTAQIWDPATGQWTTGAAATKPRLYHSNAILLPDASVLTAGGGSPGPVVNLNGEIYYPPYLYANDGSGNPAQRPVLLSVQGPQGSARVGQPLVLNMGDANPVSRVTLVRSGTATHATNVEQRFLDVTPTMMQNGSQVTVTVPSNPNVAMPGYYLVFAFNQAGVPAIAQQILIKN